MHARFGPGMVEREFPRVQHWPRKISATGAGILSVPYDGMTYMLQMDPNLMSASTVQPALQQGRSDPAAYYLKISARVTAALARDRHLRPVNTMPANRGVNRPAIPPQFSKDEREINLLNRAGGELTGEIEMSSVVFGDEQATTRSFIEPMNDSGPLLPADPGQISAVSEKRVHYSSAISTGARMDRYSGWLIDHNQIAVLEQDRQSDRFSLDVG